MIKAFKLIADIDKKINRILIITGGTLTDLETVNRSLDVYSRLVVYGYTDDEIEVLTRAYAMGKIDIEKFRKEIK